MSLGERLWNRRIELRLLQREVADQLGVSVDTITLWENGIIHPRVRHYPRIIAFWGYFPFEVGKVNFKERVMYYRYNNGLTPKEFGNLVHADVSTVLAWEAGKHMPSKKKIKIVEEFTNSL